MALNASTLSRRDVLRTVGGSLVGVASMGLVGARTDVVEVNVGYAAASGREAALAAASEVKREFDFDALTITVSRPAFEPLGDRADVRYVEENGSWQALAETLPWGIDRVDADVVHDRGGTGDGAHIAIIDTGIDSDHPDLQYNVGSGKTYVGSSWEDDNGHGTHCAGIADARDNSRGVIGVSTQATLHAVKVLDSTGTGTWSDVAAGIEWTADQGYDVGSLSLGGTTRSSVVQDAVEYADGKGVLLVAAAGNRGPCSDCVVYPAAEPECIAVSATTPTDSLASYSSVGPEVELAAPGGANDGDTSTSVYSTVPGGYGYKIGTSMATPHVSGTGAMLMANGYTATEARNRMNTTAEDVGLASNEQGYGLLDVEAALANVDLGAHPTVRTDQPTDITLFAATLNGTVTDMGAASSVDVWFEWGEYGLGLPNTTTRQTLTSTGSFSQFIGNLDSGTWYEYRAVVEGSGAIETGDIVAFETQSGPSKESVETAGNHSIP